MNAGLGKAKAPLSQPEGNQGPNCDKGFYLTGEHRCRFTDLITQARQIGNPLSDTNAERRTSNEKPSGISTRHISTAFTPPLTTGER